MKGIIASLLASAVLFVGSTAPSYGQLFSYDLCFGKVSEFVTYYKRYKVRDIPVCGYSKAQMDTLVKSIDNGTYKP